MGVSQDNAQSSLFLPPFQLAESGRKSGDSQPPGTGVGSGYHLYSPADRDGVRESGNGCPACRRRVQNGAGRRTTAPLVHRPD